ncbi:oxidoreductase [Macrolepiota fuliginosa MF-IS2]|uniref:Oxidoreductase n=1 Tax=Macrolepiota fuliginosa MF-IS2 TaxID=1400762 RepID=A0A9P5XKN1_9AGAR|nr:oxidoreductase [Macrolepiota fuliginosa MF-IS2]
MSDQINVPLTTPGKWSKYMIELYMSQRGPQPLGTVVFDEIEERAKEKLKEYPGAFMYAGGNAGTHQTYRANRRAFEKWGIVPRMLVDATIRDLRVNIFGKTYSSPLLIAPIGVQSLFHPDGEIASSKAAKELGVPYILSTACSRTMEEVAAANGDGDRWYQLYWPISNDITISLLNRAKAAGFSALVVTLDTMALGWRPHDLERAYLPFWHGVGTQIGESDPVFMSRFGKQPITKSNFKWPYQPEVQNKKILEGDEEAKYNAFIGMEWLKECNSGKFKSWEHLRHLRENWEGPLVLKGIQTVSDAEKALEFGVNGIIVSNHGESGVPSESGRQVDGAIPSLFALERIAKSPKIKAAQQSGQLTLLFDSGIRTGPDIFKALALGAQAILLGRPWLYGMVLGGQAGAEQVIKHTLADFDNTVALAGYTSIADIQGKGEDVLMKLDL